MSDNPARTVRPRRSALFMPGANPRALEKGRTLAADVLIMDLEDGVLPDRKAEARERIVGVIGDGGYAPREIVVRANGIDSEWFADDLAAIATSGADAVLLPKVDGPETVIEADAQLARNGAPDRLAIWAMMETPLGVLNARDTAASSPRLGALMLGTADLSKELHSELHTRDRLPLLTSIGLTILAARAHGLAVLDAPHFDLSDDEGFLHACRRSREMGFDGKTLLHPKTIDGANEIFGPSAEEIDWSRRITAAWRESAAAGKGVTLVDGKLIEGLHVTEAERVLAMADMIAALERASGG